MQSGMAGTDTRALGSRLSLPSSNWFDAECVWSDCNYTLFSCHLTRTVPAVTSVWLSIVKIPTLIMLHLRYVIPRTFLDSVCTNHRLLKHCCFYAGPVATWSDNNWQYASTAWSVFCSAADNGKLDRFPNRCRKLYRCQQLNQDISELFNLADQAVFSSLQKNSHHVLHRLHVLPAKSTQP